MQNIKQWPEADRPREKLFFKGADALTEAEILAIILGTGDSGSKVNALDLGRILLSRFGSLSDLNRAGVTELIQVPGIGKTKAARLKAALELSRRLNDNVVPLGCRYRSSQDIYRDYHPRMKDLRQEVFILVLLDAKNRRLKEVTIATGSLTEAVVHPREVFFPVIQESAANVVFLHNHPSGDPSPSSADIELTRRLCRTAEILGVTVVDHVIVARTGYTSFADSGLLRKNLF